MKIKHLLENESNIQYYVYLYVFVSEFEDPLDELNAKLHDAYLNAGVENGKILGPEDYENADDEFPITTEPVSNLRVAVKRAIYLYDALNSIPGIEAAELAFKKVYSPGLEETLTYRIGDLGEFIRMNYTTADQLVDISH